MEMELQLGLALPGFDQNKYGCACAKHAKDLVFETKSYVKKYKRSFEEAFGENNRDSTTLQTLPLLSWSSGPSDEEDDHRKEPYNKTSCTTKKKNDEEENGIVGWPPIKSWRKKQLTNHDQLLGFGHYDHDQGIEIHDRVTANEINGSGLIRKASNYVKVKMEGVAIARKIDLRLYDSYQTLLNALISMFRVTHNNHKRCEIDVATFTITYQDKEGDWLLAGDLPWLTFKKSAQRLKIVRNKG